MKTCPVCNRNYSDHMKYCSRDGTTLQTGILLTACPECGINYPSKTTCPIHNLELVTYSQKANPTANFCNLCNQFYPLATQNCPLHGVELQVKIFNANKVGFESSVNVSPVVANILEEITSSKLNESEKPLVNDFVTEKTIVTSNLENTPQSSSIETKNLTAPAVLPFDTLGKYAVSHFSSSADRKLFVALALIVLLSVVGFAAYSLPYALEWAKVSADTEETNTVVENKPSDKSSEEINETIEPLVKLEETKEANISQIIPEPIKPTNSTNSLDKTSGVTSKKSDTKVDTKTLSSQTNKKSTNSVEAKSKTITKQSKAISQSKATSTESIKSESKQVVKNQKPTVVEKTKPIAVSEKATNPPVNKPKLNDHEVAKGSAKSPIRTWEPSVTAAEIKNPVRQKAKVVLSIANKSRLQTSNGYIYQFDLVVRELNGVGISWNSTSAYKSSYSGNNDAVSNFLDRRLAPNATERYRMSIKMTGHSIEDWFGEIIYKGSGIDENGNSIELRGSLALDNSF
jgi:hypothetical protein